MLNSFVLNRLWTFRAEGHVAAHALKFVRAERCDARGEHGHRATARRLGRLSGARGLVAADARDPHGALSRHEALGLRGAAMSSGFEAHRQRRRLRHRRGREPRHRRSARPRHRDLDVDHGDGARVRARRRARAQPAGPRRRRPSRAHGAPAADRARRPFRASSGPTAGFRAARGAAAGQAAARPDLAGRGSPRARRADSSACVTPASASAISTVISTCTCCPASPRIVAELAAAHGVASRALSRPSACAATCSAACGTRGASRSRRRCAYSAGRRRCKRLRRSDDFVGFYFGGRLDEANLATVLAGLPSGRTVELMCHPGDEDMQASKDWAYAWARGARRTDEPAHPRARDGERGMQLVSYRDV